MFTRRFTASLALGLAALALASCTVGTTGVPTTPVASVPVTTASATESKDLVVVTHDSFALDEKLIARFKAESGYAVTFVAPGDGGTLTNQLVLTKDSPLGDVVYGLDNTFAGRALMADVLVPYASPDLPAAAASLAADDTGRLTPIDQGDVCVNADMAWFAKRNLALPVTLDDLAKPAYKDLLVAENPASSSTGLGFLVATVGAKGDPGYLDYWAALKANGVKIVQDWETAYYTDFSGSEGKGPRPLVVSYASSPSAEVPEGGTESRTTSLLQTCFRQVEYAGVIAGATNEVGARKFIDFLLSDAVQADIPGQMYMYPINPDVALPESWTKYAPLAEKPFSVSAEQITAGRDGWIRSWTTSVIG